MLDAILGFFVFFLDVLHFYILQRHVCIQGEPGTDACVLYVAI